MTDLRSLLEKVETATGPDRSLDARIYWHLKQPHYASAPHGHEDDGASWGALITLDDYLAGTYNMSPLLTSSLDAVLSLVEEKLPDHDVGVFRIDGAWEAQLGPRGTFGAVSTEQHTPTPALALLAALLRALIAKQEREAKVDG